MENYIINWSEFLLRNKKATVNGKTYKKDGNDFLIELFNQWLSNSDEGKKYEEFYRKKKFKYFI